MKISAAIITFNEERNISRAIESLRCCDEIVVVDSGSTDRTVELAVKHGSRVIDILLKCSDSELRVKCKRFESRDRYTTLAAEQLVAQQTPLGWTHWPSILRGRSSRHMHCNAGSWTAPKAWRDFLAPDLNP
jgi:glycosyltransferase involved in cell wall biosynthesis